MTAPTPTDSGGRYWAVVDKQTGESHKGGSGIPALFPSHVHWVQYEHHFQGCTAIEVAIIPASTYTRLLAIEAAAVALIDGTGGKSKTTEYGECYVPQDADFERLAEVVEHE